MALWMFTAVKEGFEGAAPPFLVLVGKTSRGDIYYADVDVPFTPKWHRSSLPGVAYADATRAAADAKVAAASRKAEAATTAAAQAAALAEVDAALAELDAAYRAAAADVSSIGVAYGQLYTITGESSVPKISSYDAATSAPASAPALKQVYIDDDGTIGGIDAAGNVYYGSSKNTNTLMKSVAFSGTNAYGVGTDGSLYFTGNPGSGTWTKTNAGTSWKQVVFSGPLACAINTAGNISYALNDITTAATKWKTNSGPIVCPTFTYISLQGRRLIGVGTDTNIYYTDDVTSSFLWRTIPIRLYTTAGAQLTASAPTFTAVEIMYPDPSARRKRFADVTRSSASAGSTLTKSCSKSETLIGNYCYQPCPDGQIATGTLCPYMRKHIPAKATCPAGTTIINNTCFNPCSSNYTTIQGSSGSTVANYTEDPANNQQCLGATIPKIKTQPSTTAKPPSYKPCDAYNGSLEGRFVRIKPTQSYTNNKLCLTDVTVMGYRVDLSGNVGTSLVNLSSSGRAFSTDGVCPGGPIGLGGCSFKSGTTYDTNTDGGKADRVAKTYWEVDLGALHYIKSVAITACSNAPPGAADDTLKQMSGAKLQVLTVNNVDSQSLVERVLGPSITQTFTFNFGAGNAQITDPAPNICYDLCPMVAGVQSVPQGNASCRLDITTITNRSVTTPQIVRQQVILPPADLIAENNTLIDTTWVADPTDTTQYLTCSDFPDSRMVAVNRTLGGFQYSYKNSSTGEVFPNVSGYICIKTGAINASMCPTYTSTNNGDRPDLLKHLYDPTTISCYIPRNVHRHWSCNHMCKVRDEHNVMDILGYIPFVRTAAGIVLTFSGTLAINIAANNISCDIPRAPVINTPIDPYTYCCTGRLSVPGRGDEQRCWTNTSVYDENMDSRYGAKPQDNFGLPSLQGNLVRMPTRMPAKIGCFDSNGDSTPGIFKYNNACARCVSENDTFYATGLLTPETPNTNIYGMYKGQAIAYTIDSTGKKRAPPIPTAFADDYIEAPPTTNPSSPAPTSTVKINEVYGPQGLSPAPPPLQDSQKTTTTITGQIVDGIRQATNFFSSLTRFKPSGFPTVKYFQEAASFMRTLKYTDISENYPSGICVAKCTSEFSKVLPVQMHKIFGKYVLWGVTCESPTGISIMQDKIPAEYIPGSGSICSEHTAYNSSDKLCYSECNTLQIDNGTTCTYKTVPRPYVSPTYSCTNSSLTLAGSVCLYGCKEGTVANGAYCDPVPIVLPKLPTMYGEQVIMCNKTPGGKKSGKDINKWLCEDSNNAYLLVSPPCNDTGPDCIFPDPQVTNPNVPYSYIGPDDIICHADSSGSTVYVCQSPSDYINAGDTAAKEQANSQMTCDNLSAAYLDLSSNLTVLTSSGKMAQTSATRLANMQATLQGVYNVLCGHSTPLSSCPTLQTQIAALKSSINSGSSTLANIINPYEMGMSSRTMLVGQMNSMGCTIPK